MTRETMLIVLVLILSVIIALQSLLIDRLRNETNKLAQSVNSLLETLIRAIRK